MVCADVHTMSDDLESLEISNKVSQVGVQVVFSSIGIEAWVEHSDVNGLLHVPGGAVIFQVKDLCTAQGDPVAWPPIKVQVL